MDAPHAEEIIKAVHNKKIDIIETHNPFPSPFAFSLIMSGYSDVIRIEDKHEFLRRMHQQVLAKISLKDGKKKVKEQKEFSYQQYWQEKHKEQEDSKDAHTEKLKMQVWSLKRVPVYVKAELIKLIENGNCRQDVLNEFKKYKKEIEESWPDEIKEFILVKL